VPDLRQKKGNEKGNENARPMTPSKRPTNVAKNVIKEEPKKEIERPKGVISDAKDDESEEEVVVPVEDKNANQKRIDLANVDAATAGKFVRGVMKDQKEEEERERALQQEKEEKSEDGTNKIRFGKVGGKKGTKAAPKGVKKSSATTAGPTTSTGVSGGALNQNDVDFIKAAIQALCQNTNPLGKSMDFLQEDIDSMTKEYEKWKKESKTSQSKLEELMKVTEDTIQPLQDKLVEIEEQIREQTTKVNNVKSQMMSNDVIIQNLLHSVISTR